MALAARRIPRSVFAVAVFFSVVAARVARQGVLDALGPRERYSCHGGVGDQGNWIFDANGNYRCCTDDSDCTAVTSCIDDENNTKCYAGDQYHTPCAGKESTRCLAITNAGRTQIQLHDKDEGIYTAGHIHIQRRVVITTLVVSTLVGVPASPPSTNLGSPVATSRSGSVASMTTVPSPSTLARTDDKSDPKGTTATLNPSSGGPSIPASSSGEVNTPSSQAAPTLSGSPLESPTSTTLPSPQKPSGKMIGIFVTCSVLGACILGLLLAFGWKWYNNHQRKQKEAGGGILPKPRQQSPNDKRPSETSDNENGDTTRRRSINNAVHRSHRYPRANGSVTPPRLLASTPPPKSETNTLSRKPVIRTPEATELSTLPPSARQSAVIPDSSSSLSPASSLFSKTTGRYRNPSPPYTATPTPVSPFFPVSTSTTPGAVPPLPTSNSPDATAVLTPTTAGAERLKTRASQKTAVSQSSSHDTLRPPNDYVLKSSTMSHMAGPYLTAEKALGEGFWEAEREQLEADKAIGKAHEDGTTHDEKDDGFPKTDTAQHRHVHAVKR